MSIVSLWDSNILLLPCVFFPPYFFYKPCSFFPSTGAIPSEKSSSHISSKAQGLSGPGSDEEGERPR